MEKSSGGSNPPFRTNKSAVLCNFKLAQYCNFSIGNTLQNGPGCPVSGDPAGYSEKRARRPNSYRLIDSRPSAVLTDDEHRVL